MSRFTGKVVLITGGARGQGRSHAVGFGREGADVAIVDVLEQVPTVPYPTATPDEAAETARELQSSGRRCLVIQADVRDSEQMSAAVQTVEAELGPIDVLVCNAGIASICPVQDMSDLQWHTMINTNLTGVFNSIRPVLRGMCERRYGRIVATSSIAGRLGAPNIAHYVAAKWGVIGLVKAVALEVAPFGVTVNAVAPTSVNTPMIHNQAFAALFVPDVEEPSAAQVEDAFRALNPIPVPWVEPEDVTNAVLFLAADHSRYISGEVITVSAGWTAKNAV